MKRVLFYTVVMVVFLPLSCVPKRTWQGKYITLTTTEHPKEDFKVRDYVVVSYTPKEYDKKSSTIYRFDIMENGKRKRVIEFSECFFLMTKRPAPNKYDKGKDYDYALTEIEPKYLEGWRSVPVQRGTTYKLYEKLHTYGEIKNEVIDVLFGRELEPEE
jgi:hypothetical protein